MTNYTRNGRSQIPSIDAVPVMYGADQNATGMLGSVYGYDTVNRLTSTAAAGGLGLSGFTYDAYGRLVTTTTDAAMGTGGIDLTWASLGPSAAPFDSCAARPRPTQ